MRRVDPADADARREDLGQGAEVDDPARRVERVQRRQRLALEAQLAVGVVLHEQQVALLGVRHQRAAALEGERGAGRVLERRDDVEELRRAALRQQPLVRVGQPVEPDALAVHRHLVDLGAAGREGRHGAGVGRPLGQDRVARVEHDAAQEVDRLLPAGRDDELARARLGAALGHQRGQRVAELVDALGRPVLQRARPALGDDALGQLVQEVGREGARVRQAARQRDDLGPRRDGHEVAHGRRAERPRATRVEPLVRVEAGVRHRHRLPGIGRNPSRDDPPRAGLGRPLRARRGGARWRSGSAPAGRTRRPAGTRPRRRRWRRDRSRR